MAQHELKFGLALVVMAAFGALSSAQPTPQAQPNIPNIPKVPNIPSIPSCPPGQFSLSPCISYFIGNSSLPSTSCCSQLQTMFQSQSPCLCAALKGAPGQLGSVISQAQAMILPKTCNIPTDPCNDVSGSSTGPAAAPTAAPTTPTNESTVPSATGNASPAATTTPQGQPTPSIAGSTINPAGAGSKTTPSIVRSAAVRSSTDMAVAMVLIQLLFAFVSAIHRF